MFTRKTLSVTVVLLCLLGSPGARAADQVAHVILISIDGLRADAVTPTRAPALAALLERGAFTLEAQCVTPSLTIPNHVSMLTGLTPATHGFLENWYPEGIAAPGTVLELVEASGGTAALYVAKEKLRVLNDAAGLTRFMATSTGASDTIVSRVLTDLADPRSQWTLSVIHLAEPDVAGHQEGFMSAGYLEAVRIADRAVGRIVQTLEQTGLAADTLLIVTTDHGGIGSHHLRHVPAVTTIPWLAVGPRVPHGLAIRRAIHPYDTAPTILAALGLPVPETMEGSVIEEVVGRGQAQVFRHDPAGHLP